MTNKVATWFFYLAFFPLLCGCANSNIGVNGQGVNLDERIQGYYELLKNGEYRKCITYWDAPQRGHSEELIKQFKQLDIKITHFSIDHIESSETSAEVLMALDVLERGEKPYRTEQVDRWRKIDGVWYIKEFGKTDDKELDPFTHEELNKILDEITDRYKNKE